MKKLILITCLFIATLLGDDIDSTQYKFAIYPELGGLGIMSINLAYFVYTPKWSDNSISSIASGNYSIRFGMGIAGASGVITHPISIYKIIGEQRNKLEIGIGSVLAIDEDTIGALGLNWKYESKSGRIFSRIGIVHFINQPKENIKYLPTIGLGIKL